MTTETQVLNRHYYRCLECLDVFAVEHHHYSDLHCACGGRCEYMGRVQQDVLVRVEERTACDDRCTHARGPNCDCKCGGRNHGTGKTVTIIKVVGKPTKAENRPNLEELQNWKNNLDSLDKMIKESKFFKSYEKKALYRKQLNAKEYDEYCVVNKVLTEIQRLKKLKTWDSRNTGIGKATANFLLASMNS